VDVVAGHEPGPEADHEGASARGVPSLRLSMRASTSTAGEAARSRTLRIHGHRDEIGSGTRSARARSRARTPSTTISPGENGLGERDQPPHGERLGTLEHHDREAGQEEQARGGRRQLAAAPHDHGRGRHVAG
jgi:hypothetical protein